MPPPLVLDCYALLWLNTAPPDNKVGSIPYHSTEQLASHAKGKHALLIGGTSGIGFGTALALVKSGANVTIVGRDEETGNAAVSNIQYEISKLKSDSVVEYIQGDIGTVSQAYSLIQQLEKRNTRYEYLVVTAARWPDWNKPMQNEDGVDVSFGIGVVGRFIYRNLHRFMTKGGRVLNVLASGEKFMTSLYHRDVAMGKRNPKSTMEGVLTYALGNEVMISSLFKYDKYFIQKHYTFVSTKPGFVKTDLNPDKARFGERLF